MKQSQAIFFLKSIDIITETVCYVKKALLSNYFISVFITLSIAWIAQNCNEKGEVK